VAGRLAHICLLVQDLDRAIADWQTILEVVDPDQLTEPIVRVDRFEAGGDVMRWATFVNAGGCEIQLLQPLEGPLFTRLEKRGEHIHHFAFCGPDLPGVVEKLDQRGIRLTSKELSQDPVMPWQAWTFISPESSHGALVELAWAYRAVEGHWIKA
jgi:methylmalonyl-CoA/ethylmalonyl-CoA epimerase